MKKTTIIFALILAVMMSLFFVGCNPAANTPNTPTTQGTPSEVTGTTFNAGNMSVLVPKGWCGVAVADSFNEFDSNTNPNQAYVAKGSNITTDMEVYEHPYILVMHIPADKTYYEPSPLMYDNVEFKSITIDGQEWTGFSGKFVFDCIVLWTQHADGTYSQVTIYPVGSDLSMEDSDVQAIMRSIKYW